MGNVIVNGDFATDLSGWTLTNSSFLEQGSAPSWGTTYCGFFPESGNYCSIHQHVNGNYVTQLDFKIRKGADASDYTLKVYCDSDLLATYSDFEISSLAWDSKSLSVSSINPNASIQFRVDAGVDTAVFVGVTDIVSSGPTPIPVAAFTGSPLSGSVPFTVTFTDASTETPTSWAWDFGDGGTSTEQSPTHWYTSPGLYDVSLVATNAGGSDTETKTDYIAAYSSGAPTISAHRRGIGTPTSGGMNAWGP